MRTEGQIAGFLASLPVVEEEAFGGGGMAFSSH
jgi:hypothetical protein